MNWKAVLQDTAITLAVIIALSVAGARLTWPQYLIIIVGLGVYGFRNGYSAYRAGFSRGHDCGMSHKPTPTIHVADKAEFDKIIAAIEKDFPVK